MALEMNIQVLQTKAIEKEDENIAFRNFLNIQSSEAVDELVFTLNDRISPQINCTDCGNCCKGLMVNITDAEADNLSAHFNQSREDFDKQYVEKGETRMILNAIPCAFLSNNACTVYEYRFAGCKEFPALHLPAFTKRLFTTFMHYDRCPIIYHVVEELKLATGFISASPLTTTLATIQPNMAGI